MNAIPFIPISNPHRIRAAVSEHAARGCTPPRCPWCRHWQPIGYLWTCQAGHRAGSRTVECEGFEAPEKQMDMFREVA